MAGAFFCCHEFTFVEDAFAPGLAFVIQGGMTYVGGDEAGAGPHDVDAGIQQFCAQGFEPALEGELGGGIGAPAGEASIAGDRGYSYDGALSFEDGRQGELGAVNSAEEIDLHYLTGYFRNGVQEECPHADAGVIDEDVDATEGFDGGFDKAAAFLLVADVAGYGVEEDVGVFDLEFIYLVVVAPTGGDFGSLRDEGFDQCLTYAIAATCDYDYFILEERHTYGLWVQT